MKSWAGSIALGAGLALAGCTARPLQSNAGATGDGGASFDGPLFSGRRSFVVASTLTPSPSPDGGATGGPLSHTFTMVVEGDSWTAISGGGPYPNVSKLEPAPGGFRILGSPVFALPACSAVSYSDLSFELDPAGRLLGNGSGTLFNNADGGNSFAVTMSLTGVDDTVGPTLAFDPAGDITDPFIPFSVLASEPLQVGPQPLLRAAGGDVIALTPSSSPDGFVALFYEPNVLLRYGETYRLDISGVVDFAGNAAVGSATDSLTFTTRPAPPLVAADGFESVTSATLGGAEVLSGAGDPIISGGRSLYVPPASPVGAAVVMTQFALRLAVAPGDTVVRLAYRVVNPNGFTTQFFAVASSGTKISTGDGSGGGGGAFVTIDGTEVALGPIATASIPLPDNAAAEVIVAGMTDANYSCSSGPQPTELSGVIIDDLRSE
jgi:hypothetical protein